MENETFFGDGSLNLVGVAVNYSGCRENSQFFADIIESFVEIPLKILSFIQFHKSEGISWNVFWKLSEI